MPGFLNSTVQAFVDAWTRSFDYQGRSNRGDYWYFALANLILSVVLLMLSSASTFVGWIYSIWSVATFIPGLSLSVRRLRDAGNHWAWLFILLLPVLGAIWLLWLFIQPSV